MGPTYSHRISGERFESLPFTLYPYHFTSSVFLPSFSDRNSSCSVFQVEWKVFAPEQRGVCMLSPAACCTGCADEGAPLSQRAGRKGATVSWGPLRSFQSSRLVTVLQNHVAHLERKRSPLTSLHWGISPMRNTPVVQGQPFEAHRQTK